MSQQRRSIRIVSPGLVNRVLQQTVSEMRAAGVPPTMANLFYVYMSRAVGLLTSAAAELGRRVDLKTDDDTQPPCFDEVFAAMIRAFGIDLVAHAYASEQSLVHSRPRSLVESQSVCMPHVSETSDEYTSPPPRVRRSERIAKV